MNHFYSNMLLAIIGSLLWLLIGILIMRSKIGSGDVIAMLVHDVSWVGYAMFWFCLLLWPIYLALVYGSRGLSAIQNVKKAHQERLVELVIRPDEKVLQSINEAMELTSTKTYSEYFGNAFSFYHFIATVRSRGDEIYIHHADGSQTKVSFPDKLN